MKNRTHRSNVLRAESRFAARSWFAAKSWRTARPWLALAFSLTATLAGATEPDGAGPVGRAAGSSGARPQAPAGKSPIGRIFFSPAERRARHQDAFASTPATAMTSGPEVRERRLVNGALRSSSRGRAVWVNGAVVDDSARDKSAWTDRNGNVWLMNGAQGTHLLKPGQSIDRNGVIEDLLPPGAVARR